MKTSTRRYLTEVSRLPQRAWERTEGLIGRRPEPPALSNGQIMGLAALAVAVALGIYYQADFVRYMKMRRM